MIATQVLNWLKANDVIIQSLGSILTHFRLMFHFFNPLKTSESQRFSDVFRGYRSGTLVENGLNIYLN